jgi:hypothetical protein
VQAPVELVTVIVKLHVAVLFASSVAVQSTVVVPTGKLEPEGGLQETFGQFPVAVVLYVTVADPDPGELSGTVMLLGQVIVGVVPGRVS